jgi:hypothetical protein
LALISNEKGPKAAVPWYSKFYGKKPKGVEALVSKVTKAMQLPKAMGLQLRVPASDEKKKEPKAVEAMASKVTKAAAEGMASQQPATKSMVIWPSGQAPVCVPCGHGFTSHLGGARVASTLLVFFRI